MPCYNLYLTPVKNVLGCINSGGDGITILFADSLFLQIPFFFSTHVVSECTVINRILHLKLLRIVSDPNKYRFIKNT